MTTGEKPRVLVVDDDEATTTLISAVLDRDYTVEVASDGAGAVDRLKRSAFAAVLLDLRMPVTDGYDVLDFLRTGGSTGKAIIVTGSLMKQEVERVTAYRPFALVRKPFDVEELLRTVHACTDPGGMPAGGLLSCGVLLMFAELLKRM